MDNGEEFKKDLEWFVNKYKKTEFDFLITPFMGLQSLLYLGDKDAISNYGRYCLIYVKESIDNFTRNLNNE
jgi:hypothetical protein